MTLRHLRHLAPLGFSRCRIPPLRHCATCFPPFRGKQWWWRGMLGSICATDLRHLAGGWS